MKKINTSIWFGLLICIALFSCSEKKMIQRQSKSIEKIIEKQDLDKIKEKKRQISLQYNQLKDQLALLNKEIDKLDTVKKIPLVTVINVKDTLFRHFLELQGSVETKKNVIVYPEFSGILSKIYIEEGQSVKKGELLAKIDDGGLSQKLAQLRVQYQLAKTTYERQKRLWDQKIGSEIQYLQAKSTMSAQQKGIQAMEDQLAKTYVKAPFSGIIDRVITERGSVVRPGSQLFKLVNLDKMYVKTNVPENYLPNLKKGTLVEIYFPVLAKKIDARISRLENTIDENNRTFSVEIDVPNKNKQIKPNLSARLKINDYTKKTILIPESIISENAMGKQYVYLAQVTGIKNQAKAVKRIIETGLLQNGLVEIISGLKSKDRIVGEGARNLKPGLKIAIKNF